MALLTVDLIGSSRASPPQGVLIQGVGDDQTLRLVQVLYRNLSGRDLNLHVESLAKNFSRDFPIPSGTQDTVFDITPAARQPDIELAGPQGLRFSGLATGCGRCLPGRRLSSAM